MSDTPNTTPQGGDDRLARRVSELTNTVQNLTRNQEDQALRSRIASHGQSLASALAEKETAIGTAEGSLAQAHDDGDPSTIARKQRELTEAISARDSAKRDLDEHRGAVRQYEAEQERKRQAPAPQAQPAPEEKKVDYTNLNKWKDTHKDWYGVDADMTQAAHEIDQNIRKAGVLTVGSTAYFEAVDKELAKKYPDRFRTSPQTAGQGGGTVTNTNTGGRIPQSVVDGWARMGINTEDPKVMERMVKHRERLVDKGILPEKPVYERVVT